MKLLKSPWLEVNVMLLVLIYRPSGITGGREISFRFGRKGR